MRPNAVSGFCAQQENAPLKYIPTHYKTGGLTSNACVAPQPPLPGAATHYTTTPPGANWLQQTQTPPPPSNNCYNVGGILRSAMPQNVAYHTPLNHHQQQQHHVTHMQQQQQQQQQRSGPNIYHSRSHQAVNVAGSYNPQQPHNYAKLPPPNVVNQQRINECAGIPLISNASAHLTHAQRQRLHRKTNHSPSRPTPPPPPLPTAQRNWLNTTNNSNNNNGALPLGNITQLAAHAHGMPLLQANKASNWPTGNVGYGNAPTQRYHTQSPPANNFGAAAQYKLDKTRVLRYQNSAPPALSTRAKENSAQAHLTDQNNANGEKDTNETCLPRIIKPRKRRKKDRKPTNGVFLKLDAEVQQKLNQMPSKTQQTTEDLYKQLAHYMASPPTTSPTQGQGLHNVLAAHVQQQHMTGLPTQHGICFCADCDPLRSIWDYPLRRSGSNSSNSEQCSSTCSTHSSDTTTSCASSTSDTTPPINNFDEAEHFSPITGSSTRAEIVGVIGSNRNINEHNGSGSSSGSNNKTLQRSLQATTTTSCLSDSNDSGYGDILSGINIADDLFRHAPTNANTNSRPTNATTTTTPTTRANEAVSAMTSLLLRMPETEETLLNERLNEISRKLIETCTSSVNELLPTLSDCDGNVATPTIDAAGDAHHGQIISTLSCPMVVDYGLHTDSGIDSAGSGSSRGAYNCDELIFNFEHLNMYANNNKNNNNSSSSNTTEQQIKNVDFLVDYNNNNNSNDDLKALSKRLEQQHATTDKFVVATQQQKPIFNNCFDLVWQNIVAGKNVDIDRTVVAHDDDDDNVANHTFDDEKPTNSNNNSVSTPTSALIFGTVGKLKSTFSTIS